jgi:hypothetical protein
VATRKGTALADVSLPSLAMATPAGVPRTGLRGLTQQVGARKRPAGPAARPNRRPLAVVNSVGELAAVPQNTSAQSPAIGSRTRYNTPMPNLVMLSA